MRYFIRSILTEKLEPRASVREDLNNSSRSATLASAHLQAALLFSQSLRFLVDDGGLKSVYTEIQAKTARIGLLAAFNRA